MPIPGERPDLSARPPQDSPVKRRLAVQYVRDARDRLISSSGTRPAFDYELMRQYAQNRFSTSLVIRLLVASVGFLSSLWTGAVTAGIWTASVLVIHAVMVTKCRQFLELPMAEFTARAWRFHFILLDLFYGLAWMFLLTSTGATDENSGTFMLFIALHFALQATLRDYMLATLALTAQS
jgi:two-component system cell cycle sensor histidine kinase PleC